MRLSIALHGSSTNFQQITTTFDQQAEAVRPCSGCEGRSAATTVKVGRGQYRPPSPTIELVCRHLCSVCRLDCHIISDVKPSGKMYAALLQILVHPA